MIWKDIKHKTIPKSSIYSLIFVCIALFQSPVVHAQEGIDILPHAVEGRNAPLSFMTPLTIGFGSTAAQISYSGDITNESTSGANLMNSTSFDVYDETGTDPALGTDGMSDLSINVTMTPGFDPYGGTVLDPLGGTTIDVTQSTSGLRANYRFNQSGTNNYSTGDAHCSSIEVRLPNTLTATADDFTVNLNSVNTCGEIYESAAVVFLNASYAPYGSATYEGYYNATFGGSPPTGVPGGANPPTVASQRWATTGTGVYLADSNSDLDITTDVFNPNCTATSIERSPTSSGDPNAMTDGGLPADAVVGGFIYTVCYEDVAATTSDGDQTSSITNFTGTLNGFSAEVNKASPLTCVAMTAICDNATVTATASASGEDTDLFLLTDNTGLVLATNATGVFDETPLNLMADGTTMYNIYVLNYSSTSPPDPIPAVGDNVNTVGSTTMGCFNADFLQEYVCFTVNPLPTITSATPDCAGGPGTGTIEVVASISMGTLEYSVDGNTYQASSSFSNLDNGTYTVYVRENTTLCESTLEGVMIDCNMATCVAMTAICDNATVTATASASGEDTDLFLLTDENGVVIATNATGIFDETPLDLMADGMTMYNIYVLNYSSASPPDPIPAVGDNVNTVGSTNMGCYNTDFLQEYVCFTVNPLPTITSATPDCTGGPGTGTIEVVASISMGTLEYSVDGNTYQASSSFSNLDNGTYTVYVRETTTLCEATLEGVMIDCNMATCVAMTAICDNATVTATASASGEDTDLFLLTDENGVVIATNAMGIFDETPLDLMADGTTVYNIYVLNYSSASPPDPIPAVGDNVSTVGSTTMGCYNTDFLQEYVCFTVNPLPTITSATPDCAGGTGTIEVVASISMGTLEYSVDGNTYQASSSFSNLDNGTYTVYVRETTTLCEATLEGVMIDCNMATCVAMTAICDNATVTATASASGEDTDLFLLTDENGGVLATNATGVFDETPLNLMADGTTMYNIYVLNYSSTSPPDPIPAVGDNVNTVGSTTMGCYNTDFLQEYVCFTVNPLPMITSATPDCTGGAGTGTIEVVASISMGTLEYSVDGTTYQASSSFSNLANGTYTIYVREVSTLCEATLEGVVVNCDMPECVAMTTICDNATVTATASASGEDTDLFLLTDENGVVLATNATGVFDETPLNLMADGTTMYNIYVLNYSSTSPPDPIPAVGDNVNTVGSTTMGCFNADFLQEYVCFTVNPLPMITSATPDCTGGAGTGTIEAVASISPGTLEYSVDGTTYQASGSFSNLANGTYTIYVREVSTLCEATLEGVVVNCDMPECVAMTTICDNATVTATASASGEDTDLFLLTDENGVVLATNATGVFDETPLNLMADGTTMYNIYVLNYSSTSPPDPIPAVGDNVNTVGSTTMGCYNTDFLQEYVCFTINPLPMITSATPDCTGGAGTGTIEVVASISMGTLEYSVDGTTYQASGSFSNLANGTYTIYVREVSTLCEATLEGVVVNCDMPECVAMTTICDNATVTATASASGEDTDLFLLTDENGVVLATNATGVFDETPLNLMADGTTMYNIYVLNYSSTSPPDPIPAVGDNVNTVGSTTMGCFNTDFLQEYVCFTVNPLPMITSATPDCTGGAGTGTIEVVASISMGTLEYSVDGTTYQASGSFSNLANGTYTIYVREVSTLCEATLEGVVVNCDMPECVAMTTICDNATVTATASASGEDTDLFLLTDENGVVLATNATGVFDETPLNLMADGTTMYNIYVLNYSSANPPDPIPAVGDNVNTVGSTTMGCFNADFLQEYVCFTVNESPNLVITDPVAVCEPNTVDITVPAVTAGSTLPSGTNLTYHTGTPANAGNEITAAEAAMIGTSGIYYILATSNTTPACTDEAAVNVVINDTPTVTIDDQTVCADVATVDLTELEPQGQMGGTWTTGGPNGTPVPDPTAADPNDSPFTYSYTDANGCTSTVEVIYTIDESPMISGPNEVCVGETIQLTGTGSPLNNPWSTSNINIAEVDDMGLVTGISGGQSATITYTGSGGCTADHIVMVNALPTCNATNSGPICSGESLMLNETGSDAISWSWTTNGSGIFDDANSQNPTVTGAVNGDEFTVTIIDNNGCTSSCTTTVSVNDLPDIIIDDQTVCADVTTVDLTELEPQGQMGGTWTTGGPNGTPVPDPTAANPNDSPFTYSYEDENNCTGTVEVTYTISPLPTPVDPMISICTDETMTNLTDFDATVLDGEDGMVSWYDGDPDNGGVLIDPATAVNLNNVNDLWAEVTLSGPDKCHAAIDVTVTINPLPIILIDDQVICEDVLRVDLTALEPMGQEGGTWATAGGAVVSDPTQADPNDSPFTYSYTDGNGCTGMDNVAYSTTPSPTPVDPMISICADETMTNLTDFDETILDGEDGTVAWFDGDPNNGGTLIDPATAVNLNNVTDLWAQVTLNGGENCQASVDVSVNITPLPTPVDPMIGLCMDETMTNLTDFDATVLDGDDGTVAWFDGDPNNGGTLIDPATAVNLNNVTDLWAQVTLNGEDKCEAVVDVTVTISETPTPADPMISICADETMTNLTDFDETVLDGENGTVAWYDGDPDNGGSLISPATAVNLNNVTDLWAQVILTTGNCQASIDVTVTINPIPTPVDPMISICADETMTNLTAFDETVLDGEDGTVAWYDGDPDNGGSLINPATAVDLNNVTDLWTQVTLTTGNCQASIDVTVTINPIPTPVDPMISICADETMTNLTDFDETVLDGEDGTVAWHDGDPDNGGSLINPATAVDLNNVTDLWAQVTLNGGENCTASIDVTVTINPIPTPVDPDISICADETMTNLTAFDETVLDGEDGTVAWYDGDPDNGGTLIAPATAVDLNNVTDLWAQVTLNGGENCQANIDVTVTIHPLPTPADPMISICEDETMTNLTDFDNVVLDGEDGTVAWFDGDPNNGGTLIDPATAVNLNNVTDLWAQVTLNAGKNCQATIDVTVTINPSPTPVDPMISICVDETMTNLTDFDATVLDGEDGTVAWYDGDPDNGGTIINPATAVDLNNVNDLWGQVTLNGGLNCQASIDITVELNALPTANPQDVTVCINSSIDIDGMPSGGSGTYINHVWTIDDAGTTGIMSSNLTNTDMQIVTVNTTGLNEGTVILSYTVTDDNGCTNSATVDLVITSQLNAGDDNDDEICNSETMYDLTELLSMDANDGGTWEQTSGMTTIDVSDPTSVDFSAVTTMETFTFTYTIPAQGPCPEDEAIMTIIVHPIPIIVIDDQEVCADVTSVNLTSLEPTGQMGGTWTTGGTVDMGGTPVADATDVDPTTGPFTYSYTDGNMCTGVDEVAYTIHDLPEANPEDAAVCIGNTIDIDGMPSGGSGTYTTHAWVIDDAGTTGMTDTNLENADMQTVTVNTTGLNEGTAILSYTVTDDNGCMISETLELTLDSQAMAGDDNSGEACNDDDAYNLEALLMNQDANGTWMQTAGSPNIDLNNTTAIDFTAVTMAQTFTFTYTVEANGACPEDVATIDVVVSLDRTATVEETGIVCTSASQTGNDEGQEDLDILVTDGDLDGEWTILSGNTNGTATITGTMANMDVVFDAGSETGPFELEYTLEGQGACEDKTYVVTITRANCTVPDITNVDGPTFSDPCTCLNNATTLTDGQFSEELVINNSISNTTWTVTAVTGLFNIASPNPPAAPIDNLLGATFTENPNMPGQYTLVGVHVDAIGYTVTAESLDYPGVVLTLSNTCFYPEPIILAPTTIDNCDDSFTVSGFEANGVIPDGATLSITGPGGFSLTTSNAPYDLNIDPSNLVLGTYTATFTFDAGTATNAVTDGLPAAEADPGCITTVVATFEVVLPNTVPTFENCVEGNITVDCESDIGANFPTLSTDDCLASSDTDLEVIGSPGCPGTVYIYTFTAIDAAGQVATCTQTYTIAAQDFMTSCPSDLALECNDPQRQLIIQNWLDSAGDEIQTNCGRNVNITNNYNPNGFVGGCSNQTGSQAVTFTITDDCGNVGTCTATIDIIDTEVPTIVSQAVNMTRSCESNVEAAFQTWLNNYGGAHAFDFCGNVSWSILPENPVLNTNCNEGTSVTFVASDGCGNTSQTTAIFMVVDNTPPQITDDAENLTVICDGTGNLNDFNAWLNNAGGAQAQDACGTVSWTTSDEDLTFHCEGSSNLINVTFTATDDCGNSATTTATFKVLDNVGPTFDFVPEDISVACHHHPNNGMFGTPTVSDNCSDVTITFEDETIDGECTGGYTIRRTWTATDDCGNTSTATQNIEVFDDEPPLLFFNDPLLVGLQDGDEITISCSEFEVFTVRAVTYIDNCDYGITNSDPFTNPNIDMTDVTTLGFCDPERSILCTWTAMDDCGNLGTLSITINIVDDEAPQFTSVPDDVTIDCDEVSTYFEPPVVADNCNDLSDLMMDFEDEIANEDCDAGYEIIRTWTVNDRCGNTNTFVHHITVNSHGMPVIDPIVPFDGGDSFTSPIVDFKVFPNPVSDVLKANFEASEAGRGTIQVYGIAGRTLIQHSVNIEKGLNETSLNVQQLKEGIYTIVLTIEGEQYHSRFIKINNDYKN